MLALLALVFSSAWAIEAPKLEKPNNDLCSRRQQYLTDQIPFPSTQEEMQEFLRFTLQRLRQPIRTEDTCPEELLTYLIEKTPKQQHENLANQLGLQNQAQRDLFLRYGFLLIEGGRNFNNGREPEVLLSFFDELQKAFDIASLDKGLKVMALQRPHTGVEPGERNPNGTTFSFSRGMLSATRVAKIYTAYGEELRDSIDNSRLVTVDQATMVMIHELAHGIFETQALPVDSPFVMGRSSANQQPSQPVLFTDECFAADYRVDPAVNVDQVIAFYQDLVDRNLFAREEQEKMAAVFRPANGDLTDIRRRIPSRLPTQKARFYGASAHAEDWSTSWEAYFYSGDEMWSEALTRERLGLGTGLKRRFSFLAKAFSFLEGGETYSYIFDTISGRTISRRVKLSLNGQGNIVGFE